uniref:DNA-directed RNA polymerase III subunit RPC7 n=1 Tax=Noccaea caerulescens TaxID=107243 RepID=A0A1J3CIY7_NOCCA
MAYRGGRGGRGRGRGRGGFGGGEFRSTPEPFVIYPEITLPNPKSISIDNKLLESYSDFQRFWKTSSYHLGDGVSKQKKESLDIERNSDSLKPKKKANKIGSFYDFLVLRPDNFPKELLGETRRERPVKRARWTQDADLQKLDLFEKLEAKYKAVGKEDNPEGEDDDEEKKKEKKEDDEDDDEDDKESEISISSGGDYDQNEDFDDDDDDYNRAEDVDVGEPLYN